MDHERDYDVDLIELGAASELTEGAVFGTPERDGLKIAMGLIAEE